jgi:hypothetical protein
MVMTRFLRPILTLIVGMWICLNSLPAFAAPGELQIPPGFELVHATDGVTLYKKNFANGSPDYVQIADLSMGGRVHVLHGDIVNPGEGQGVYGGDNPRFNRKSIQQFWHELKSTSEGAFCVANGQFFRLADSPTPLPFPLKKDGHIISDGYGIKEFPDQKLMLEIWSDHLDIRELSQANLYSSTAPDIVVGLTEDAEKASKKAVGRTFVGISDRDGDRVFETLYIFSTQIARPSAAANTLREFGAIKVMMLDGGGSTQLECNGEVYIDTDRLIPQAIGISAGEAPTLAASLRLADEIPIIIPGEKDTISLEIQNEGLKAWQPGNIQLLMTGDNDNIFATLDLTEDIPPGGMANFEWAAPFLEQGGLQRARLSLSEQGERFSVQSGSLEWVSLPVNLRDKRDNLEVLIQQWSGQSDISLETEILAWLQSQTSPADASDNLMESVSTPVAELEITSNLGGKVRIGDAAWIPLLMIPAMILMIIAIRRAQRFQI